MNKNIRTIAVAAAILFAIIGIVRLLSGKNFGEPNVPISDNPDEIFTMTVHDFPGYRVDNLDEDETTNFIVYAKDAKEIEMSDTVNILESADDYTLTYVFSSADKTLRSMRAGDVFFGYNKDNITQYVSIKVRDISVKGKKVTVYGEEASLSDFFYYVDINMPVSTDNMIIQPANGITVDRTESAPVAGNMTSVLSASPLPIGNDTTLLSSSTNNNDDGIHHIDFGTSYRFGANITISTNNPPEKAGLDGWFSLSGDVMAKGSINYTLTSADLKWRYDTTNSYLETGVVFHGTNGWNLDFTGTGKIEADFLMGTAIVPCPICPIVQAVGDVYLSLSVSGSIKGGISGKGSVDLGVDFTAPKNGDPDLQLINDYGDKEKKVTLEEINATFLFGPKVKLSLGAMKLADVYGTILAGVEFNGKYTVIDVPWGEYPENIHGCDVCIAGTADIIGRSTLGFKIGLSKDKRLVNASLTFPDLRIHIVDFYLSLFRDGKYAPEFAWTTCPHKNYRAVVSVDDGNGNAVGSVNGTIDYGDYSEELFVDNDGKATVYLPNGDATITVTPQNEAPRSVDVTVNGAPVEATISFDPGEPDLFIVCDYNVQSYEWVTETYYGPAVHKGSLDEIPELTSALKELFPNAQFVSNADFNKDWHRTTAAFAEVLGPLGYSRSDAVLVVEAFYDMREHNIYIGKTTDGAILSNKLLFTGLTELSVTGHNYDYSLTYGYPSASQFIKLHYMFNNFASRILQFRADIFGDCIDYVAGGSSFGISCEEIVEFDVIFNDTQTNGSHSYGDRSNIWFTEGKTRADYVHEHFAEYTESLLNHYLERMKALVVPAIEEMENPTGRTYGEILGR